MTAVAGREVICAVQVVIGVDTRQDEHVAVAIDQQGVRLAELYAPATSYGYGELERWSRKLGEVCAFGVEGTGSYGAGLARFLTGRGFTVVEVNRPDRSTRYRKGKSDPTDAEMAARAVLAGVANATPSITTSVQGGMWGDARMAARRLAWERRARSLLSCVSSSHRSNSSGPNRSRGSISRTTR